MTAVHESQITRYSSRTKWTLRAQFAAERSLKVMEEGRGWLSSVALPGGGVMAELNLGTFNYT